MEVLKPTLRGHVKHGLCEVLVTNVLKLHANQVFQIPRKLDVNIFDFRLVSRHHKINLNLLQPRLFVKILIQELYQVILS